MKWFGQLMDDRSVGEQIENGFRITGLFLFGAVTMGLFWTGTAIVTHPGRASANSADSPLFRALFLVNHPIIAGWIFLIVSTVILLRTMDGWVKVLPVLFVCRGGLMWVGLSRFVPRDVGIYFVTLAIVAFVAAFRFGLHKLRVMDRVALMGFQVCFALGLTTNTFRMVIAMNCGLGCLLFPWAVDFFFNRKSDKLLPPANYGAH